MKTKLLLLGLSTAIGCSLLGGEAKTYVLEIAGQGYRLEDFDAYLEFSLPRDERALRSELKAALFDQFVEEQLLLRSAKDERVDVSADDIRDALNLSQSGAGEQADAQDMRMERLADGLRVQRLLETKVLRDLAIAPDEIEQHFNRRRADYRRMEVVDVSQILVEAQESAEEIRKQLMADPSKFEEFARNESIGPEAARDGQMGSFSVGQLPPSLENEVFKLSVGKFSEVVATDFGFHIFRVNGKTPSRELSLEDVRDAIQVELLRKKSDDAMSRYLADLKQRYPVVIYSDRLNFQYSDSMGWETVDDEIAAH